MIDMGAVKTNGGVLEYFKKDYHRDEGCSEADFVRLSLQLWRATGSSGYLNRAETCLYNSFFPNQFSTGDFGHHDFDARGYITVPGPGRAWWCCTMHGLRALRDVLDNVISQDGDTVSINLFMEGCYISKDMTVRVERTPAQDKSTDPAYHLFFERKNAVNSSLLLNLRLPGWMDSIQDIYSKTSNGSTTMTTGKYKRDAVKPGEKISLGDGLWDKSGGTTLSDYKDGTPVYIQCTPYLRLLDRNGEMILIEQLSSEVPKDAAIFYGPWLMGVDAQFNPMFHGEPWEGNILQIPNMDVLAHQITFETGTSLLSGPHIRLNYTHGGFSDPCQVTLRPVSEQTTHEQTTVSYWHQVQRLP
jgi:hypothetical protein